MIKTIKIDQKKPPTESAEVHPQVISIGGVKFCSSFPITLMTLLRLSLHHGFQYFITHGIQRHEWIKVFFSYKLEYCIQILIHNRG